MPLPIIPISLSTNDKKETKKIIPMVLNNGAAFLNCTSSMKMLRSDIRDILESVSFCSVRTCRLLIIDNTRENRSTINIRKNDAGIQYKSRPNCLLKKEVITNEAKAANRLESMLCS